MYYSAAETKSTVVSKYVSLEPFKSEMYEGVIPMPVETIPKFRYKGPKMPLSLWQQVLHWFKTNSKGEAMIRFFVDFETGTWHAIPFPQHYPTGMSVKEIEGHELTPNTGQLVQLGSAHHHCTAGAFPSGTDNEDEARIEGLHLIVGNVDKEQQSIFLRLSIVVPGELRNGVLVKPSRQVFIGEDMLDLRDLFTDPALQLLPYALQEQVIRAYLTQYFGQVTYPKQWDTMLIPPANRMLPPFNIPNSFGGTTYVVPSQINNAQTHSNYDFKKNPKGDSKKKQAQSQLALDVDPIDSAETWYEDDWILSDQYRYDLYSTLEDMYLSGRPRDQEQLLKIFHYLNGGENEEEIPDLICHYSYYLQMEEIQKVVQLFSRVHDVKL